MTSAKSVSATFTATSTLYPSLSSPVSVATDGGQLPRIKKWGNNIYVLNGDNNRNLMFYKSTDNGTTFASTILATPVSNSYEYEFSMDTNGCLYAIWESANDSQMYIRRSLDGGITWSSAASVANGFGWMDNPSGYFSNGTLFLLFRGWKNSKIELYLTRSTDYGNTFSTPVQVTDNTIQENTGKIAVFGNNVYVVYFDWDSANTYLVTSLNGGSSFGSPIQVNRTSGKSGPGSSVGVDLAGNIFVVYSDTTSDGEGDLYVAKSANGGSSFTYALAADSTYRQQEYPRIFIDANDYVNLLWNDNRDNTSYGSVYYTRSVDGGASYEANVNIRSSGGISNGSLYVDSGIVNIVVTDYKTSPFSTIFYRLTWLTDTAPVITSAGTASGTVNQSFTYLITATNSPTSYAVSGLLPAGLSVNQSTGLISGMPTASGTFNVTVNAANAGGTGSKTVTITIAASISIIPGDLNNDRVVDLADAILGLQITGGIKPVVAILKEADVNGDNKIGIEEVIYILQFIAGLRSNVSTTIPPGTVQGRVLWNEQPVTGATVYATDL
ncbi:MAG: exo-alpha-sialidase, partial [Proteobacteria bacterium]|nr:exo-alpha-sialidase [Pseudomonadota bacterium]